jgi:acetyltransferase-like isoleucine patch superfamily enzyme
MTNNISPLAIVSSEAKIGADVNIWAFAQIRENAHIGHGSNIGSHVYIDSNVKVGRNCKIQTGALLYDRAVLNDGVFVGPGAILTNDKYPRATSIDLEIKSSTEWVKEGVEIGSGASIGAGSVCIAPVKIGAWAVVGAGSVVTKNIPSFALVVGNPARQIGWVGKSGMKLIEIEEDTYKCPQTNLIYKVVNSILNESIGE